ncbi:MAG: hypothetical protein LBU27_08885 [Candidatus Peribacteria bacterium]|nr:hypothetical protein [Candidatus Peribacteria bacterium]
MEIFIGYDWNKMLQVGFYKDQDISAGGETVDDVYSNGQLKKMTNGNKLNINFTMHELTPEKRAIVQNGLIELQGGSIAGDVVELLP